MTIIYIPGVWDLLHVGHLRVLQFARGLGDRLVVGVPCDRTVLQDKGQPPVIRLEDRVKMLEGLRCVDLACPYYDLEFLGHLNLIRPDILAVGATWGREQRHREAEEWVRLQGKRLVKLPYYQEESTSRIKQRVVQSCIP